MGRLIQWFRDADATDRTYAGAVAAVLLIIIGLVILIWATVAIQHAEIRACNDKGGYYVSGGQCIRGPQIVK